MNTPLVLASLLCLLQETSAVRREPYKGWADTYTSEDAGLIRWFVRQMAECERQLDSANLPARMEDVHKAQLLLGYLADHPKSQAKEE